MSSESFILFVGGPFTNAPAFCIHIIYNKNTGKPLPKKDSYFFGKNTKCFFIT